MEHHEGESCEETQGPAKLGEEILERINLHLDKDFRLVSDQGGGGGLDPPILADLLLIIWSKGGGGGGGGPGPPHFWLT